jgi:elongator complex protein 3
MVVAGTVLERWYREGRYQPYDDEAMIDLTIGIKSLVPGYVRISRVLRDIPSRFVVGGLKDSLRDTVRERMKQAGTECRCTRCREYGHRARSGREIGEPRLVRLDYEASAGSEVFLSFEDEGETLFGLLRLRLQARPPAPLGGMSGNAALVRELHVFGPEVPLREQRAESAQHRGLGRSLLGEAERIAREEFGAREIAVLSGTGAREYYRGLGYRSLNGYMVRDLRSGAG